MIGRHGHRPGQQERVFLVFGVASCGALAEALPLVTGTTMRTVARAPRLRRNGSGPLEELRAGGADVDGDASAVVGGCDEGRVAPDDWTAGNPIIVFLRGGLEE